MFWTHLYEVFGNRTSLMWTFQVIHDHEWVGAMWGDNDDVIDVAGTVGDESVRLLVTRGLGHILNIQVLKIDEQSCDVDVELYFDVSIYGDDDNSVVDTVYSDAMSSVYSLRSGNSMLELSTPSSLLSEGGLESDEDIHSTI